jgi:hypothetical protein
MRPPKEFYAFCSYLHQESALVYGSEIRDMVRGALRQIPEEDGITLRVYSPAFWPAAVPMSNFRKYTVLRMPNSEFVEACASF